MKKKRFVLVLLAVIIMTVSLVTPAFATTMGDVKVPVASAPDRESGGSGVESSDTGDIDLDKVIEGPAARSGIATVAANPTDTRPGENLSITIRNNHGLLHMEKGQFTVYQLFKGDVAKVGETDDPFKEWFNAENWYNLTLADLSWGDSSNNGAALDELKQLREPWVMSGGENVFKDAVSAPSTAAVLEGKGNDFMQHLASWLADNHHLIPMSIDGVNYKEELGNDNEDPEGHPEDDYIVYSVPEPGYYLFVESKDHSDGSPEEDVSEFIIAVLGSQQVDLKGSQPEVDKVIVDSDHSSNGDVAQIDDIIRFKIEGDIAINFEEFDTYYFSFTDTLCPGLTYHGNPEVYLIKPAKRNGEDDTAVFLIDPQEYTLVNPEIDKLPADSTTVQVIFDNLKTGLYKGKGLSYIDVTGPGTAHLSGTEGVVDVDHTDIVRFEYDVIVNENAVIGAGEDGNGNINDVYMTYSSDPDPNDGGKTHHDTPHDDNYLYTFGLDLKKVGDDVPHEGGLSGASFILINNREGDPDNGKIAKFKAADDYDGETGKAANESRKQVQAWVDSSEEFDALNEAYLAAKDALGKAKNDEYEQKEPGV